MPEADVASSAVSDTEDSAAELPHTVPALVAQVEDAFGPGGALARRLPGYRLRQQQRELAVAVAHALATGGTLVAEAGTGTGKTYAYLVPALLHGGKVLISTGTKPLQDQLYARDIPQVLKALQMPAQVALLKGRNNYVCHWHLERLQEDERGLANRHEVAQLQHIVRFAQRSRSGDRAELEAVPETAPIWQRVTSTRDTCLGTDCAHYRDCFVVKARKAAQEAEVVVINHALFLADLALKEDGVTDLLPAADCVVFDEAHQLPDVATRFLGESLSSLQLLDLARDVLTVGTAQAAESADWTQLSRDIEQSARDFRLWALHLEHLPGMKCAHEALPERDEFNALALALNDCLGKVAGIARALRERHPDLDLLARRVLELRGRLRRWLPAQAIEGSSDDELAWQTPNAPTDEANESAPGTAEDGDRGAVVDTSESPQTDAPDTDAAPRQELEADEIEWVRWAEFSGSNLRLQSAPLSVARTFARARPSGQAWVLTSATLAVREDFRHFTRQLGLGAATTGRWESPFQYAERGRLYVPDTLPQPQHPEFLQAFVADLLLLLEASVGSALVLCTTLRAVDIVHGLLQSAFAERGWDWPLLKQGTRSRPELLEALRTQRHAVLVGSASFWEGIDVPGDALTLVAIDKLPFAPPDDPVIDARIRESRKRGGNPFVEFQLPHAAIALKQGAGRLIRAESDWGVLMVGDRRLVDKPYGKQLWRGLPPFGRTRRRDDVVAFLRAWREDGELGETD